MKFKSRFTFLSLLLTLTSCGQLSTRSYLAEMEQEDGGFYSAGDFPVVAGDTGRTYETSQERRRRTPASADDHQRERTRDFLQDELRRLEDSQSDEERAEYDQHKVKLKTTSERIYFLKLSDYERRDYLYSRGFLQAPSQVQLTERFGVRSEVVTMGMSKNEVMQTLGKPVRVEVAGNPSYENERWLYSANGATKYIYFESGRVEGWE